MTSPPAFCQGLAAWAGWERAELGAALSWSFTPFVSGATFSLRSLHVVVLCSDMILANLSPGPLTWLLALPDSPGFVTRGLSGNHRTAVGPDSHHQTGLIFFFGYCGTVLWSAGMVTCVACVHPQLLPPLNVLSSPLLLLSHKKPNNYSLLKLCSKICTVGIPSVMISFQTWYLPQVARDSDILILLLCSSINIKNKIINMQYIHKWMH